MNGDGMWFAEAGYNTDMFPVRACADMEPDYGKLPDPFSMGLPDKVRSKTDMLFRAKILVLLAQIFCQLCRDEGMEGVIPIKWLVSYTAWYFPSVLRQSFVSDGVLMEQSASMPCETADTEKKAADMLIVDGFPVLAAMLLESWDMEMKRVFAMRLVDNMSFKEIEEKTGWAYSRVHAVFRNCEQSIRRFCVSAPGSILSDMSEDAALAFIEVLKKQCVVSGDREDEK
jgi:hypothetical protein